MGTTANGERDYTFGQAVLTLRTTIGLTQAGLADELGVSQRAVGKWEAGSSYPKAQHLKKLIELGVKWQAFTAENAAEEIRALWKAARQKVLLDESWLATLLSQRQPPRQHLVSEPVKESASSAALIESKPSERPLKLFYCYAHQDKELLNTLDRHLSSLKHQKLIEVWYDDKIRAGMEWGPEIAKQLSAADIILLLVSNAFLASDYCYDKEMTRALERHEEGTACVVPIILRPVHWQKAPFSTLQVLPTGANPVTSWPNPDEAYANIAERLGNVIEELQASRKTLASTPVLAHPASGPQAPAASPRVDWGDALAVPHFYGREEELAQLSQWVVQEGCRVVSVLGMGGIGKSALSVHFMHQVAESFEVVIFRSLRDAPSCETLLDGCFQVLSPQSQRLPLFADLKERISLLPSFLRMHRALVVLDNLESLLEAGNVRGQFRPGFEGYGQLLLRVAETEHHSCLLLTSRESIAELRPLEDNHSPVRALRLAGLDITACKQLFVQKELLGTEQEQERLIEAYSGNPLALKIVAGPIFDLFGRKIGGFLAQGTVIFGNITDLLEKQFARLSVLEQSVLCWLAIVREPITLGELRTMLVAPLLPSQVLEAVESLSRRSLIECEKGKSSFTLQSVVLEYVTALLIAEGSREIQQGSLYRLAQHGLSRAHAKEYVRQTQERLLVFPLLTYLKSVYGGQADVATGASPVEEHLLSLLDQLRKKADSAQGYGPANLIALLRLLRGHLKGLDLSHLSIRGAYLQGIEMQDASLVGTALSDTVFTETFDVIRTVAVSCDGKWWAAGSVQGKVRVWGEGVRTLHLSLSDHTDVVAALAFSPDGRTLASGSYDRTVKLWDVEHGDLLWTGWHTNIVHSIAFAPDGRMLASCGADAVIRLWDVTSGEELQTLSDQDEVLSSLAWSPDGSLLASGDHKGNIWLWHLQGTLPATRFAILAGHTNWVWALAFAPNGKQLVSGSEDKTVKLWEVASGHLRQKLTRHTERVYAVAWSGDGRVVASAGFDHTIWLYDVEQDKYRAELHGHTDYVYSIAFTPDSRSLFSSSDDGTLRVWDVTSRQCVRIIEGCAAILYDVAWSPDSTWLASAGTDRLVTIWDVTDEVRPKVLWGHNWHLFGVAWSPDGRLLASSGRDNAIRLWDPVTGDCVQVLQDPDCAGTMFYGVAWSSDGHLLACGSYVCGVQVWDMVTHTRCWVGQHRTRIRRVAWSPDGTRLAGCSDDGNIYLWKGSDGTLLGKLQGHSGRVMSVDWSPDGTRLASGGGGRSGGELFVWDGQSGEIVQTSKGQPGIVFAVVWSPTGDVLVSGGSDGIIRWWEAQSGECVRTCEGHKGGVWSLRVSPDGRLLASSGNDNTTRVWDLENAWLLHTLRHDRPYERLNITGIRGLNKAANASLRALGAIEEYEQKKG